MRDSGESKCAVSVNNLLHMAAIDAPDFVKIGTGHSVKQG